MLFSLFTTLIGNTYLKLVFHFLTLSMYLMSIFHENILHGHYSAIYTLTTRITPHLLRFYLSCVYKRILFFRF